jgi:hypothetical protein
MTAILAVLCAMLAVLVPHLRPGIKVVTKNTGRAPIRSVILYVTGRAYPLGDLAPDVSKEAIVEPTNESHLEIEFVDEAGSKLRIDAGGYFEPGYRATIWVSIKDGAVEANEQRVNIF